MPICGVDILPTLCEVAKIPAPTDRVLDGTSILPLFEGQALQRKRPLYWQFNRSRNEPKVAIRDGEWKLLARLDVPTPKPSGSITVFSRNHSVCGRMACRYPQAPVFLR